MLIMAQLDPKTVESFAHGGPTYVLAGAVLVLAGVVAWMARAYRDDMKDVTSKTTTAMNEVAKQLASLGERVTDVEKTISSCPHRMA